MNDYDVMEKALFPALSAHRYIYNDTSTHSVSSVTHTTVDCGLTDRIRSWPSRDPIGEWGGMNLYGFVQNIPTMHVDPFGLYIVGPIDWAVYAWLDGFEQPFYEKWRDPAMPEPPYDELKNRVEATATYQNAVALLDAKLVPSCIAGDYDYDYEDPVTYNESTVKKVLHKTRLVQYWECECGVRTRKKLYTTDTYDFEGSYSYYFPFAAYEWVGLGNPYAILLRHE